jgi:hypothetical protein
MNWLKKIRRNLTESLPGGGMFVNELNNYTPRAQQALALARKEASVMTCIVPSGMRPSLFIATCSSKRSGSFFQQIRSMHLRSFLRSNKRMGKRFFWREVPLSSSPSTAFHQVNRGHERRRRREENQIPRIARHEANELVLGGQDGTAIELSNCNATIDLLPLFHSDGGEGEDRV